MNRFVYRLLLAFAAAQLMWGCTVLDEILPRAEEPSIENQRASIALATLRELEEIDTYIKLDNTALRKQISDGLEAQALATDIFEFKKLKVRFARQTIALEATVQISRRPEGTLSAALLGDVTLTFSGNQLIWLPHFDQLKLIEKEFLLNREIYPKVSNELEEQLLSQINKQIADVVIVLGKNTIQINPLPLGNIEVGAALTNYSDVVSNNSHELGGVFTVAGSTILIEQSVTSILLDLEFIPNISACPADVYVSRSAFASEIRNREPVGITRFLREDKQESNFFTEISGATRSTVIIHYWFANGLPVALEELQVEPSYRWRTWSTVVIDRSLARNWEVIVVEKKTGCILHSLAIRTDPAIKAATTERAPVQETIAQLRDEFERRVAGFSILNDRPDIALIEIPRGFLKDVLHASLKDIQIVVDFDIDDLPPQKLSGMLQPFSAENIFCAERECGAQRECATGFSQCARQRDSRDCTTCLFRNPLNNRCVNEVVDPICAAAKTMQNAKFERARASCMEREAATRLDCTRLRTQEIRSCEIETASEQSACESGRETVREFSDSGDFASVSVQVEARGGLRAIFSDFEIEGDLSNIRLTLGFSAALDLSGTIRFAPRQALGPLASCMNAWQKSFVGKVVLPQLANSMIGVIKPTPSALVTDWSGYVVTASINPTPLEAMFVDNPNLLADCQIGLTVDKVAAAVTGANSEYLSGRYSFEIQPSPSRIDLAMASVQIGDQRFTAKPELSSTHLKYEVKDRPLLTSWFNNRGDSGSQN